MSGLWVVRAGVSNQIAGEVEKAGVVAIGWAKLGDLSSTEGREDFKRLYRSKYSVDSEAKVGMGAGQIYRFVREMRIGDIVLTPIAASREILIREVAGEYVFDPTVVSKDYPNIRRVKCLRKVSRDDLSVPFRNALGGLMTVFAVGQFLGEVSSLLGRPSPEETPEAGEQPAFTPEEIQARADEIISDLLHQIDPYEFQNLVAGILRAMGFRTRLSPPGPDGGVDIRAFPDAFGFQPPRIKVQVKHRKGHATQQEVQQFAGAVGGGERYNGLFVSTGGFTASAIREADKHPSITLIDRELFVAFLLEHYEALEPQYKAMVPLQRVYVPVRGAV